MTLKILYFVSRFNEIRRKFGKIFIGVQISEEESKRLGLGFCPQYKAWTENKIFYPTDFQIKGDIGWSMHKGNLIWSFRPDNMDANELDLEFRKTLAEFAGRWIKEKAPFEIRFKQREIWGEHEAISRMKDDQSA